MNIQRNRWLMSRRTMLKGLGAAVALPWLEAMSPTSKTFANAGSLAASEIPRRAMFTYWGLGVEITGFTPAETGKDYKLTPSLNALLTINTDFSATEVDDRQVNLTRFGLFFPEKRDFFLREADIFEFGRIGVQGTAFGIQRPLRENGRPFFSRKIGLSGTGQLVDLDYGGKVSGRVGNVELGALSIVQDDFGSVSSQALSVLRAKMGVFGESSVGFIATSGNPSSNVDNSVAGMDFYYRNTRLPGGRTLESDAWLQQSDTDGLVGDDAAYGAGVRVPNATGFRGGSTPDYRPRENPQARKP